MLSGQRCRPAGHCSGLRSHLMPWRSEIDPQFGYALVIVPLLVRPGDQALLAWPTEGKTARQKSARPLLPADLVRDGSSEPGCSALATVLGSSLGFVLAMSRSNRVSERDLR